MEKNNEVKSFKKQLNVPTAYFSVFYIVYIGITIYNQNFSDLFAIVLVGAIAFFYLYGMRPYKYTIERRVLTIHKRAWKNKEYNIMDFDTICDPVPKMTKIITNPRCYEIYLTNGKRFTIAPKDQMGFVETIIRANKRVHCQVKEYNETHRKVEKKRKRENRREDKMKLENETQA